MNKSLRIILLILLPVAAVLFTACPNPLGPLDAGLPGPGQINSPEVPPAPQGAGTGVTLTIPRYAPWIGAAFTQAKPAGSRAFAFNDSVVVTILDSDSAVAWEGTFTPDFDGSQSISCNIILPPGNGYTAAVDIFNHIESVSEPVVSGTSAPFDVVEGANSPVYVTCLPGSYTEASLGSPNDFTITAFAMDPNGSYPLSTGGERWYKLTVSNYMYVEMGVTLAQDVQFTASVFNAEGLVEHYFMDNASGPGPDSLVFELDAGDYYIAFVCGAALQKETSGSITWTQAFPAYLTETNVPDPELRALLQDYTGKNFTGSAGGVTDLDLGALGSLRTSGGDGQGVYRGITDLTGLEYCTGLGFLLLNDNDLSSADLSVLDSMTQLHALDLWSCNLQNLDFAADIVSPNFHHLKIAFNPDLSLSDILSINAASFPGMRRLAFSGYDTSGDGNPDPVSPADWNQLSSMLAGHTELEELTLTGFQFTQAMFTQFLTDVINLNKSNWQVLDFGGSQDLVDISGLTGLSNLRYLVLYSSGITSLAPIWSLHDNDGAFTDEDSHISITGCNLELWPGSPDRTIVDNLIAAGVDVQYEWGNQLVEAVPLSDTEVPDQWLRAVMEDAVGGGKQFATAANPSPANQISTADLAALSTLDVYIPGNTDPVIISDFTGLDYCDNVNTLSLAYSDLSGINQSSGGRDALQLQGMDSLVWLDLTRCELTDLDFIENLPQLEGLYLKENQLLEASDFFAVLIPANFPNLEYLYLTGWDITGDGILDARDAFTGVSWSEVLAIVKPFSGLKSLELSRFYQEDTEFARLFNTGEVLATNADTLTSLFIGNSEITASSLELVAGLLQLEYLYAASNQIADIGSLSSLTNLEFLDISGNQPAGIDALRPLYNAGAFRNSFDYTQYDIYLNYCGLDLWPGSPDRTIVDNLIAAGVRVQFEDGNNLALGIEQTRVDVTVNFEYTGSAGSAGSQGAVILTYSDGGPAFAGQSFYYNDFTTDYEGTLIFDDPLVPIGDEVFAQIYFDADTSFSLSDGDPYYQHPTPVSVDGGSVSISFGDSNLCGIDCPDAAGGWLGAAEGWGDMVFSFTEDTFSIQRRTDTGNPGYEEVLSFNNYGIITTVKNNEGYFIGQWTYHPAGDMFEGKYLKICWADMDGISLTEVHHVFDTEAEAIASSTPAVSVSRSSMLW